MEINEMGYATFIRGDSLEGKTRHAIREAIRQVRVGKAVAFFGAEYTSNNFYARVIFEMTGISTQSVLNGTLTDKEKRKIQEAFDKIQNLCYYHINCFDKNQIIYGINILRKGNSDKEVFYIVDDVRPNYEEVIKLHGYHNPIMEKIYKEISDETETQGYVTYQREW